MVDMRKKFSLLRVVKRQPRLPREVDGALRNLIRVKMSLVIAEGLD